MRHDKLLRFVAVAQAMAGMSKDPSTRVGAVAVDDDANILAAGYNGFPRGVKDDPYLLDDRVLKYPRIVHAEANVVAQAARVGARLMGSTLVLTALYPCSQCAGLLAQAGVKRILAPLVDNERWVESCSIAADTFNQAGVAVEFYDPEEL